MRSFIIILLSILYSAATFGQEKIEKEVAVDASEVSALAFDFVQKANFKKKVYWYQEFGLDTESYEAKVKFRKHRYSIEFSKNGDLEDIEQDIKYNKLPLQVRQLICKGLGEHFDKFKILKTQAQWISNAEQLIPYFNDQAATPPIQGYELVVGGYLDGDIQNYEVTCTENGEVTGVLMYVPRPTDNLDF